MVSPRYPSTMPISPEELKALLKELSIELAFEEIDMMPFITNFGTMSYVDGATGRKCLFVNLFVSPDGEWFEFSAPLAYNLKEAKYKEHALAVLAEIAFRTKSVQCEYDPEDGEVRFSIGHWVMDSQLTADQLMRLMSMLIAVIEINHPVIVKAMNEGVIDFGCAWRQFPEPDPEADELFPDPDEPMPDLAALVERAGGAKGLAMMLLKRDG